MAENDNPEQFSLRWNNFHANLSSGFSSLLQEEDLVDVTIAVEGRFVQAHKVVLSICSPYFKELFKINPCKHPIVILKDVSYREIKGLLQFMYQGEVSISQEQLPDFLRAAELLHIKGLTSSESENPKTIKKSPKVEPSKRSHPPLKKKRFEDSPVQSSDHTGSGGEVLSDFPDFNSLPDEPTPGGSSFELYRPKLEPPDYTESESIGPDNWQMFQKGETLEQDTQSIPGLLPSINSLSTMETSDGQAGGRFACGECDKTFSRRDNLQTHVSDIHGEGRGPFSCPICLKTAKNRTSLRTHLYSNHQVPYSSVVKYCREPIKNCEYV